MTLGITGEEFEDAIDAVAKPRPIDLAHAPDFTVGPARIEPSLRKVSGPGGETLIEPKVMQVLVALGQTGGVILSRDDLIEQCWDGRVVGESSINRVVSLLRSALKSVVGNDVCVENVPKVGYRLLVSPDWEGDAAPDTPPSSDAPLADAPAPRRFSAKILVGGVLALIATISAAFAFWPNTPAPPVETLKVAMLPLRADDSVDPLYARGLEAELRSQLARVGRMEVTNSDTARQLFEEGLSAEEICARLGVDYAWVGRLTVEADRVTLSANLIEAKTKQSLFRESLSSAPDAAQNLPLRTARAIATALGRPVSERVPEAFVSAADYRLYLTALGLIKGRGSEQVVAAHDILENVTERNPQFADGWAGLAKALFLRPWTSMAENDQNEAKALQTARHALSLDPDAIDALKVAGMLSNDPEERLDLLGRAITLDPGDSEAWFWLGMTKREHILIAEEPLQSSLHMVAIDPLWPASWMASDMAAEFGQLDLARAVESNILSAAVTPTQRLLAQARLARLDGDLSGYLALNAQAAPNITPAERRFGTKVQLHMVRKLLDLPMPEDGMAMQYGPGDLLERVAENDLPSYAEFAAEGAAGEGFWATDKLASAALPLFLQDGREGELVRHFDEAFDDVPAFVAFAQSTGEEHFMIPLIGTYVGAAMRAEGRDADADALYSLAEAQIERWREADTGWIVPVIFEIDLASAKGELDRAAGLIETLPNHGWPYMMGHTDLSVIGLLRGNPLHDELRQQARVQAVLNPIEAKLTREREEVLASGA